MLLRDIQGRRRAMGCMFGLIVFFTPIFVAAGYWLVHDVF
jgi:hypothetical protein